SIWFRRDASYVGNRKAPLPQELGFRLGFLGSCFCPPYIELSGGAASATPARLIIPLAAVICKEEAKLRGFFDKPLVGEVPLMVPFARINPIPQRVMDEDLYGGVVVRPPENLPNGVQQDLVHVVS